MKVIFFGLGSIGARHANLLMEHYDHKLYAFRTDASKGQNPLGIEEVYTWEEIKKLKPEVAFITNPTSEHIKTALRCVGLGMNLFMEKPIDVSEEHLDLLIDEIKRRELASYVAYNLRFHPVIIALEDCLRSKKILHANVRACSFLPRWRPGQDHLKSYSAIAKMGGGVILELSHEFDYIDYLMDGIEEIRGDFGRRSNVTFDAEDSVDTIIKTRRAPVNLHMSLFSQRQERGLKIDCEGESIYADLINNCIEIYSGDKVKVQKYETGIKETYKAQMDYYFSNIGNPGMMNNLVEASKLFRKILSFKRGDQ